MAMRNYPGGFSGGVTIQEIPVLVAHSGSVFWVDSNGGGGSKGTFANPCLTIAEAMDLCTASKGDIIMLKAGHAEAPVVTIDVDVIGVQIIGLGVGMNRPVITPAFTVATDIVFAMSAASTMLKNIVIKAGTNTGGNSVQVHISANDCIIEDCTIEQGAVNLYGVTVAPNMDRFRISRCVFRGTAANPDVAIDINTGSGDCTDYIIQNCIFNYDGSAGLDLAGVRSVKIDSGVLIEDCTFIGMDLTAIDFNSSSTGLLSNLKVLSNNATVAEMLDVGYLGVIDSRVTYRSVSNNKTIPATTATA